MRKRDADTLSSLPPPLSWRTVATSPPEIMLAKFSQRIRRRKHSDLESAQDTTTIQIVDELQPHREVVDTAPDLLRLGSLETPFPTVSFGGYIKYYRDRTGKTTFADPDTLFSLLPNPSPLFSLDNIPQPPLTVSPSESLPPNPPECPATETQVQEAEPPKTPRRIKRHSFSGSYSMSEKSPKQFHSRWKRASCIISSSIAENELSPLFTLSSNPGADRCRRPSFETVALQSLSSTGSESDSSGSDSPDSIAHQFRHATPDSESTLPNTPTSTYSDEEDAIIVVLEPDEITTHGDLAGSRNVTWSPSCRPVSSSSYMTARSVFG